MRFRSFGLWHWLIVLGVVLIVLGAVWYFLPYFNYRRRASLTSAASLLGMVNPSPSLGPWIFALPSHDSVSYGGYIDNHFMMNVPAPTGATWSILCCVRVMPQGYFLFWGILGRPFSVTGTIWDEFQECSPAEGQAYGVVVSSSGGVRSLKKGGWAAGLDIDALDLSTPGQLYIQWMPESELSSWMSRHGDGAAVSPIGRVSPALGGLLSISGGLVAVVVGAVKVGVFR